MAQDRVEAVERALTILEAFDTERESLSLAELAEATHFYKSTLLRLIGSLERFGYVQRTAQGRYNLGSTPARLARRHSPSRQLEAWIQPVLDNLAMTTGETASLLAVTGHQVECRLAAHPVNTLRHELLPGAHWPVRDSDTPPALSLPGGYMLCQPLTHRERHLWLALSGPAGRLDPQVAHQALRDALTTLQGGHHDSNSPLPAAALADRT
ncbi:helix-turn-helix domain-containing protein [Halomonas sp. WWR20]